VGTGSIRGGWHGGPKGTITDDARMTMWPAEASLAAVG